MGRDVGKALQVLVRANQIVFDPLPGGYIFYREQHSFRLAVLLQKFPSIQKHDPMAKGHKRV